MPSADGLELLKVLRQLRAALLRQSPGVETMVSVVAIEAEMTPLALGRNAPTPRSVVEKGTDVPGGSKGPEEIGDPALIAN